RPDLEAFAVEHKLKIGTIADLIHYRVLHENTVQQLDTRTIDTDHGEFVLHTYRDRINGDIHFALVCGELDADTPTLVRVQIGSAMRDLIAAKIPGGSGWNLHRSLARVRAEGAGVVVLLNGNESAADLVYSVESIPGTLGASTPSTSQIHKAFLTVGVGSRILRALGLRRLRLMSGPAKYSAISGFELEVVEYVTPELPQTKALTTHTASSGLLAARDGTV
ncbi:MAG: bifunctional 3,4-dihydroxy-2-butanone-4-phosphate synthase/GTP cyclohydrolase II, partial [Marinobacterium sp.]